LRGKNAQLLQMKGTARPGRARMPAAQDLIDDNLVSLPSAG
jgi:hypothetical protein